MKRETAVEGASAAPSGFAVLAIPTPHASSLRRPLAERSGSQRTFRVFESDRIPWLSALACASSAAVAAEGGVPASAAPKLAPAVGWLQWSLALLLVLGALAAFLWLLRRLGGAAGLGSRHLKILGGISLGTRERVVLLQTGNKQLVLGVCPGRIQTLCVLEGDDRVSVEVPGLAPTAAAEGAFARQLNSLLGRKEAAP